MRCNFAKRDSESVECSSCGRVIRTTQAAEKVRAKCKTTEPTIGKKVVSATGELVRWAGAGAPIRTAEQRAECVAICNTCDQFDAAKDRCSQCGCKVSWAVWLKTKLCPLGKWPDTTTTAAPSPTDTYPSPDR